MCPETYLQRRSCQRGTSRRHAFTLVEVLVALAILGVLTVLLYQAFTSTTQTMTRGSSEMEQNQIIRAVLQQITRDLERAAYSSNCVNLYQPTPPAETISGTGISNSTLQLLTQLSREEGNVRGTVVNVGYTLGQTNLVTYAYPAGVAKWAMFRGDDVLVDTANHPTDWWDPNFTTNNYWKLLSDNVVGVAFRFYTSRDDSVETWNTNRLPVSVGVKIWTIDRLNYDRALGLNAGLSGANALQVFTNSVRLYDNRVFLPRSTQNQ